MARYKLKLTSLKFISPVDTPAQETATALLLKRAGTSSAVARVAKVDDELGLVFCWAFTSKAAGETYYDLHGDAIEGDFVKVCAEFMEGARAVDEMHDGKATGQVVFGMPMTADVAKAFGVKTDTEGFMVAIKPAPDVFAKFKSGEYTGVSIEGMGIREEVDKAVWSTAYVNDLPDGAFLHVEAGGKKDDDGKTVPRTLRHFPYKDASGAVDLPHLRNAISRIPQMNGLPASTKDRLQSRARSMLEAQTKKRALLTTASAGHTHMLHGVDEMTCGETKPANMPGGEYGRYHAHPWIRNDDGTITLGEQEGHTHEVAGMSSTETEEAGEIEEPVEMSAPGAGTGNSTTAQPTVKVADMDEIASLKKQLAAALVLASMTDTQKAHRATLGAEDAAAFDALTAAQRVAVVETAKAADVVVFTCDDGTEIRKSHGELALRLAKTADEAAKLAKAERAAREQVELAKRADATLSHFAKGAGPRVALLKAVEGIADEKTRGEVLEMLTGANAACAELAKAQGVNPGRDPEAKDPLAAFNAGVEAYAKANNITDQGLALERFLGTTEGRALKKSYDASRAYAAKA